MNQLDKDILDYEKEEGANFQYNRFFSSIRFGLSAFLLVTMLKILTKAFQRGYSGLDSMAYYLGILIPVVMYLFFIYYNIKQGMMEHKGNSIQPVFKKPLLAIFLLITVFILFLHIGQISNGAVSTMVVIACCTAIFIREIQYFKYLSGK